MVLLALFVIGMVVGNDEVILEDSEIQGYWKCGELRTDGFKAVNSCFEEEGEAVEVLLTLESQKFIVQSKEETIADFIEQMGIELNASNVLSQSLETQLYDGIEIDISHITTEEYTVTKTVPFETKYVDIQTIPKGSINTVTGGKNGSVEYVYKKYYKDGVFYEEKLEKTTVIAEPVHAVVQRGVGGILEAPDGNTYSYSYYVDCVATAYGRDAGEYVCTGKPVQEGFIAVDPKVIPLRSTVYIIGGWVDGYTTGDYGIRYCEDIGGGIKGNRIDIFFEGDVDYIWGYGRRNVRVYVLEE